jgi:hypothetical protein
MFLFYLIFLNCLVYVVLNADVIEMVKWKDVEHSGCGLHQHFLWVVVFILIFCPDRVWKVERTSFSYICVVEFSLFVLLHCIQLTSIILVFLVRNRH